MASRKTSRKKPKSHDLEVPRGHSQEAALILAMLDDQSRLLLQDLKGIKPAELEWQPKRGMNTIGMLLAHLAIVEVYWLEVAAGCFTPAAIQRGGGHAGDAVQAILWPVLGMGFGDAGVPLAKHALPPRNLKGWTFDDYRQLLGHARLHIAPRLLDLSDKDLARKVARRRVNGEEMTQSVRWILYHVLEHFSGHYGQILMLRHMYRDRKKAR